MRETRKTSILIALCTNDVTRFHTPSRLRQTKSNSVRDVGKNMRMASSSLRSLTDEDDVPGSKFEREPEEYTVEQLKRWLKCRGLKLSGKRKNSSLSFLRNRQLKRSTRLGSKPRSYLAIA